MQTKKTRSEPYDKAAHTLELQTAGVPTRLFTAESGEDLASIIEAETKLMVSRPLTEDGRRLLKYWLDNAPTVCGKSPGDTVAELYRGLYSSPDGWRHEYRAQVLHALFRVLTEHVAHDAGMQASLKRLLPVADLRYTDIKAPKNSRKKPVRRLLPVADIPIAFDKPEGSLTWWQTRLNRLAREGYSVGARFDPEKDPNAARTADYLFSLLNTPSAASGTKDTKDGWTVGKLSVIEWGASLKYPIDDVMETFSIKAPRGWEDIEKLMNASGEFVVMPKGFPQRWNKGESHRLKQAAFEAEEKSPKGKGRYRLLK